MPTIEWNRRTWDRDYDWRAGGDEWSEAWGSAARQWHWMLRPRLQRFLPAGAILEIGPGHGRWTQFLAPECRELTLVDLSSTCIEACRRRFADSTHVRYAVNDGRTLPLADSSVDLAFSFDSLVHAEIDVLAGYLEQLARVLKPGGAAFLHHSNLGAFGYFKRLRALERRLRGDAPEANAVGSSTNSSGRRGLIPALARVATAMRLVDRTHMRALSVSAERLRAEAARHSLACVSQEIFPWGFSRRPIDCISVLVRDAGSTSPYAPVVNREFMREAKRIKRIGALYDRS